MNMLYIHSFNPQTTFLETASNKTGEKKKKKKSEKVLTKKFQKKKKEM